MKLNVHIFIFLIVAVIAYINDIIIYCLKINYEISLLISAIIVIVFAVFLIKYKKLKIETNFQKSDFVLVYIILFCIISLLKCDYSYDTKNYHIYIQENFFNDKINFDFFPGRTINSFLFPLGDRINYIFRYFLGYRLGTIMSLYCLIIIFYQMKTVLKLLFKDMSNIKVSLLSMIPIILYPVNEFVGTYYIDNYSCIILLQLIVIFCEKKDILLEKKYLYFSALLLGIGTAIKLPNLILGALIFAFIILNCSIKNLNKIKIIDLFGLLFIFIFPFIIYAIDNYIQTGSPIYPYYNTVFKSEYFGDINWQDPAFGIPNILCSLIWPVIIAVEPLYGNNYTCVGAIWGYGYIVCIFNTILGIKSRNFTWKLSVLGVVLSVVWAIFLMGYARYAIVIPIVYIIVIILTMLNLNIKKESIDIKNTLKISLIIILSIFIVYDLFIGIRLYVNKSKQYIREFPWLQKDVFKREICEKYEIDGVWGCISDNSAMISLIRNKNTPIYNLDSWHYEYSNKTKNMFLERVKDKKIYTVTDLHNIKSSFLAIYNYGFELVSTQIIYENNIIQNKNNPWYIFEIRYVGE